MSGSLGQAWVKRRAVYLAPKVAGPVVLCLRPWLSGGTDGSPPRPGTPLCTRSGTRRRGRPGGQRRAARRRGPRGTPRCSPPAQQPPQACNRQDGSDECEARFVDRWKSDSRFLAPPSPRDEEQERSDDGDGPRPARVSGIGEHARRLRVLLAPRAAPGPATWSTCCRTCTTTTPWRTTALLQRLCECGAIYVKSGVFGPRLLRAEEGAGTGNGLHPCPAQESQGEEKAQVEEESSQAQRWSSWQHACLLSLPASSAPDVALAPRPTVRDRHGVSVATGPPCTAVAVIRARAEGRAGPHSCGSAHRPAHTTGRRGAHATDGCWRPQGRPSKCGKSVQISAAAHAGAEAQPVNARVLVLYLGSHTVGVRCSHTVRSCPPRRAYFLLFLLRV